MIDPRVNIETDREDPTPQTYREVDNLPKIFDKQTHHDQFPKQMYDDLLHKYSTHHTNLVLPMSQYITGTEYPEQDEELLGERVTLKYRNQYWHHSHDIVNEEDKYNEWMSEVDKADNHNVIEQDFYVIRADKTEPYRFVAISTNGKVITVHDYRTYQEGIDIYPIQFNEFTGISVIDQYPGEINERLGVTIRVDNGEPCNTVIAEFLSNNRIRIILGDECFSKLLDYYPMKDYNGANPEFDPTNPDEYEDLDGYYPKYRELYAGDKRDEIMILIMKLNNLKEQYYQYYDEVQEIDEFGNPAFEKITAVDLETGRPAPYTYIDPRYPEDEYEYLRDKENNRCYIFRPIMKKIYKGTPEINQAILDTELELATKLDDSELGPEVTFDVVDGGFVNLLHYIYNKQLNDEEIFELRRNLFKENFIYETGKNIETWEHCL